MQLLFFRVGSATGQRPRGTGMGSDFVLRLFCKNWSAVFLQFLDSTGLTTLSAKCKIAKLCFLYKTVNNLTSFPATIIRFMADLLFHFTLGAVMLFFYLLPMQELVTSIILLYIVPVSCGILYHFMFYSHVLLPLSNMNFKIYCNFFYFYTYTLGQCPRLSSCAI